MTRWVPDFHRVDGASRGRAAESPHFSIAGSRQDSSVAILRTSSSPPTHSLSPPAARRTDSLAPYLHSPERSISRPFPPLSAPPLSKLPTNLQLLRILHRLAREPALQEGARGRRLEGRHHVAREADRHKRKVLLGRLGHRVGRHVAGRWLAARACCLAELTAASVPWALGINRSQVTRAPGLHAAAVSKDRHGFVVDR